MVFQRYPFLLLSLLFLIPGALVWCFRRDLRPVIRRMALCALPFAVTERFFYPDYWQPPVLFDLIDTIGFGIEDVLFVVGLAAFASTAYAVVGQVTFVADGGRRRCPARLLILFGSASAAVAVSLLLGVPLIFAAPVIMVAVCAVICVRRRDLIRPVLVGGGATVVVYSLLCLVYIRFIPDVFHVVWNTDAFSDIFVAGIPLEEMLYALASGMAATAFYPYVFGRRYVRRRPSPVDGRPERTD